jgi:hypothetical protein
VPLYSTFDAANNPVALLFTAIAVQSCGPMFPSCIHVLPFVLIQIDPDRSHATNLVEVHATEEMFDNENEDQFVP